MRTLVLSLAALAALAGCVRRAPPVAAAPSLPDSEEARCQVVAAVLREQAQREGRAQAPLSEASVEPVQVFLRDGDGDVLARFFDAEPRCDLGPYRVVQTAENEALTVVLTPAADGLDWEVHRGLGPAVSERPQPMGRLSRAGEAWVSSGTL